MKIFKSINKNETVTDFYLKPMYKKEFKYKVKGFRVSRFVPTSF